MFCQSSAANEPGKMANIGRRYDKIGFARGDRLSRQNHVGVDRVVVRGWLTALASRAQNSAACRIAKVVKGR